jgi:replicative DNA helicase
VLFVGALLWAAATEVCEVLKLVDDDDIASPALASVLAAIRRLNYDFKPHGPQLVLDELQRSGDIHSHHGVAGQLQAATTSGADPTAARHYAAAVVAAALRRRVGSAGEALTDIADVAPEDELPTHTWNVIRPVQQTWQRLLLLRNESA